MGGRGAKRSGGEWDCQKANTENTDRTLFHGQTWVDQTVIREARPESVSH